MNDEQVFALLAETNPVPDVDRVAMREALLDTDREGPTMTTDTRAPSRPHTDWKPATGRHRGPLVAAAAALVVLIAGAAIWAMTGPGDDLADQPGMTEVLAAYEAMNNGDLDGFYAQLTDQAVEADDHEYRSLTVEMHTEFELLGPCRVLEPSPTSGLDRIQCDVTFTDDFFRPAGIDARSTDTFVIAEDGRIDALLHQLGDNAAADEYSRAFWRWLADAYPAEFDTISWVGPENISAFSVFAHTDEKRIALEYVDEFIAQSSQYPITETE